MDDKNDVSYLLGRLAATMGNLEKTVEHLRDDFREGMKRLDGFATVKELDKLAERVEQLEKAQEALSQHVKTKEAVVSSWKNTALFFLKNGNEMLKFAIGIAIITSFMTGGYAFLHWLHHVPS